MLGFSKPSSLLVPEWPDSWFRKFAPAVMVRNERRGAGVVIPKFPFRDFKRPPAPNETLKQFALRIEFNAVRLLNIMPGHPRLIFRAVGDFPAGQAVAQILPFGQIRPAVQVAPRTVRLTGRVVLWLKRAGRPEERIGVAHPRVVERLIALENLINPSQHNHIIGVQKENMRIVGQLLAGLFRRMELVAQRPERQW